MMPTGNEHAGGRPQLRSVRFLKIEATGDMRLLQGSIFLVLIYTERSVRMLQKPIKELQRKKAMTLTRTGSSSGRNNRGDVLRVAPHTLTV